MLTQGDPTGDVAFGVDNTFATRALDAGVFAPYDVSLPPGASRYLLPGDDHRLAPIDNGNVCVNVDTTWFRATTTWRRRARSTTWSSRRTADLLAVPGATTSSTGLAFLLGTIGKYGDQWPAYWQALMANDATLTDGWSQAYETDFTQGGGHGRLPIVVSYDSSPGVHRPAGLEHLDHQGAARHLLPPGGVRRRAGRARRTSKGAQAFVDFLLSPEVQRGPAGLDVRLPGPQRHAAARGLGAGSPCSRSIRSTVSPADISAHRDDLAPAVERHRQSMTTPMRDGSLYPGRDGRDPPAGAGDLLRASRSPASSRAASCSDGQLDVGGVLAVLGRPEIQRAIWFTLWSSTAGTTLACVLGLPAAHVLHRLRFPGRTVAPRAPRRPVRAAHRGRRGRLRAA